MSTRCNIGILTEDDRVLHIYCHWDGYPEHILPILLRRYNSVEKITELINLGSLSYLGEELGPSKADNSFESIAFNNPECTVAYHRDRGDAWEFCEPHYSETLAEYLTDPDCGGEFRYLFNPKDMSWVVYHSGKKIPVHLQIYGCEPIAF